MKLQTLADIDSLDGKKVIVRVDFNVSLEEDGSIRNDKRIRFALPTIQYLLDGGVSQIILMTHVGRPKKNEPRLQTGKIAKRLQELLGETVVKVDDWGEDGLPDAKIIMLENLRFNPAEKSKEASELKAFGEQLASLADIYVNEAFSNSHRNHASMTAVPKIIPGYAGLGVEKEVSAISGAINNPNHPVVAVIAGAKADKLSAIGNLLDIADKILMGGALAFALRGAEGKAIGDTKVDREGMEEMSDIVDAVKNSSKVMLPDDAVVATEFDENAKHKTVSVDEIEKGWMALDIGPATIEKYSAEITKAKTVLWFGPLGVFEWPAFAKGTEAIGRAIAESDAVSIVGGGDSGTAVEKFNLASQMTHVSTGGGASLKMIEGKSLPALEVLKR